MAIIRNTASMMLKGKVGATTYYVAESRQLARQAMNNSNYGVNASRTDLQQARRVKWSNLVNFYSANKAWMKKAYEDLKPGISIFNRFMQLNINSALVALTKNEAQAKIWIPASYRVSQGSLRTLGASLHDGEFIAPDITIKEEPSQEDTVAQISRYIIAQNPNFINGDAIVCVILSGTTGNPGDATGILAATYKYTEFVLDTSDNSLMSEKYPTWLHTTSKFYQELTNGEGCVVYIHTRKSAGKLYVSTEDIFIREEIFSSFDAWRSEAQLNKAIRSYGESTTVPLAPGGQGSLGAGNDSSTGGGGNDGGDGGGSLG